MEDTYTHTHTHTHTHTRVRVQAVFSCCAARFAFFTSNSVGVQVGAGYKFELDAVKLATQLLEGG